MAFDYGISRCGIAVGEDISCFAQALRPLKMKNGQAQEEELTSLLAKWQPDAFVIGIPLSLSNLKADKLPKPKINIADRVIKFADYLKRKFDRPCYFVDERLSSRIVAREQKANKDKASLDSRVAQMLLTEWLNQGSA